MPFSYVPLHKKTAQFSWYRALLAVLFIGLLAALGLLQNQQFAEAGDLRDRVAQSYRTRAQIETIMSLHKDVETGQRGFVLTANPEFLAPYRMATARLQPELDRLSAMTVGQNDPGFHRSVERLARLSREKLNFANSVILLGQDGRWGEAAELIASGVGENIMDEIRDETARMDQVERQRLEAATKRADASRVAAQRFTFALEAALLLLLGAGAWFIGRTLAAMRKSSERLADLSARQEAIFDAATDGMITHDPQGYIENLNPSAAAMFGYDQITLLGEHIGILFDDPPTQKRLVD